MLIMKVNDIRTQQTAYTIEEQLNYFYDSLMIGLNSVMPSKLVKLHQNDTPWMTPYLKDLIHHRLERKQHLAFQILS